MERLIFPDFMKACSPIFALYFSIRYIVFVRKSLLSKQATDNQNERMEKKQTEKEKSDKVLLVVQIILISFVCLFIMFFFNDNLYYQLIVLGISVLIFTFLIIFGTKTTRFILSKKVDLSRDKVTGTIFIFSAMLYYLCDVEWNNVWNIITECVNYVIADIFHAILLVILYFLYIIVIVLSVAFIFKDLFSFLTKRCKKAYTIYDEISNKIFNYDPFTLKFRINIKNREKLNAILNIILDVLFVIPGVAILIFKFIFDILDLIVHELLQFFKFVSKVKDDTIFSQAFKVAIVFSLIIVVSINRYYPIFIYQEQSTSVLEFVASSILLPLIFEWIQSVSKRKIYKN